MGSIKGFGALAGAVLLGVALHLARAGPATAPATSPTTRVTATTQSLPDPERDKKRNRLFDLLMGEYKVMLEPREDRIVRALGLVSVARVPRADATDALMIVLADAAGRIQPPTARPVPVVRNKQREGAQDLLVASLCWECILARLPMLNDAQFDQFISTTETLLEKQAFRGELRVGLVRLLQAWGPEPRSKAMLAWLFDHTSYADRYDLPVLVAMGKCLFAWHTADVTDAFMGQLSSRDHWLRADYVLHGGRVPFPLAAENPREGALKGRQAHLRLAAQWWASERPGWTGPQSAATSFGAPTADASAPQTTWRDAPPHLVPPPPAWNDVDPESPQWRRELELRRPELHTFDLAFLLDVTGSMGNAILWLKTDVANMAQTLQLIAPEPRLGVTFYRDFGDAFVTKTVPIDKDLTRLGKELAWMTAAGGGDIPEAVREAFLDCLKKNPWSPNPKTSRVLVLIGDAPPHPQTQKDCEQIARQAAEKNFHLYAIRVVTGFEADDLTAFDQLAQACNGATFDADVRLLNSMYQLRPFYLGIAPAPFLFARIPGANMQPKPYLSPDTLDISPTLMSRVLADQIDHPYEDRIEPIVRVAWESLRPISAAEKRIDAPPWTASSAVTIAPKNPQAR